MGGKKTGGLRGRSGGLFTLLLFCKPEHNQYVGFYTRMRGGGPVGSGWFWYGPVRMI